MRLLSMMALALATTIIASCNSEEDNPVVEPEYPAVGSQGNQPTKGSTLHGWRNHSIDPWYGGGTVKPDYFDNARVTRTICDEQGSDINPVWQEGDKIVFFNYGDPYPYVKELTLSSGAGTATATFALPMNVIGFDLFICYVRNVNNPDVGELNCWGECTFKENIFLGQDGTLAGATNCNLFRGEFFSLSNDNVIIADLTPTTSMLKFDVNAPHGVAEGTEATLTYMSGETALAMVTFTVGADGWNTIYMAVPEGTYTDTQSLVFKSGETEMTETLSDVALFTGGEIYYRGLLFRYTNLSEVKSKYTAYDGETLWGRRNVEITIPHGATVRLKDVLIKDYGFVCEGDATIIIEGTNVVDSQYPLEAIRPGPEGTTLTIKGGGSLTAQGSPGIGINSGKCGDIVISGGHITAYGGDESPGIGARGGATCGNILINGGTVTAKGGPDASGIGSGRIGDCGDITITKGVNRVTAYKGEAIKTFFTFSIGGEWFDGGSCGRITIGGEEYTYYFSGSTQRGITGSPFIYEP